ncbi:hypothetical protein EE612_035076 [Oryza sativa]|nr:hypothetical protein EE612_035076 [Oryza sativa]
MTGRAPREASALASPASSRRREPAGRLAAAVTEDRLATPASGFLAGALSSRRGKGGARPPCPATATEGAWRRPGRR